MGLGDLHAWLGNASGCRREMARCLLSTQIAAGFFCGPTVAYDETLALCTVALSL